ncbi:MAG: hypothetical protein V3R25_02320 [Nitrosomonadaceae bacterium]
MELLSKTDEEILMVVNPIMDNLMEGSTEVNYEKHARDLTDRLKKIVTKKALQRMCSEYQSEWGLFEERVFIALFRRTDSVAVVWKQSCSKTDDEFVAEAVFVEKNRKYLVDHTMVF